MKTDVNCIPCFYRQVVEAAKMAGAEDALIKRIVDKVGYNFRKFDLSEPPPSIARKIQKIVRSETGIADPYKKLKTKSNFWAQGLQPQLEERVERFKDKLLSAVHIAIAGNIIDYGANAELHLQEKIEEILNMEDLPHQKDRELFVYNAFKSAVEKARTILYLADNAGEVVFDKILLKQIKTLDPAKEIFFAVRNAPILNDCLEEDARDCRIDEHAVIVSTGSSAPGVIPEQCSTEFQARLTNVDLIISKGQGNYESLVGPGPPVFHLFIVKCPAVATALGCDVGDTVLTDKSSL